ncbi:MAG TPA: T9SS type A sorting domain-containing protein, partial [Chitinophagales bacterium]|nr:T9SS type A sorting domain-containing protein [Chitinophagales bacterium]
NNVLLVNLNGLKNNIQLQLFNLVGQSVFSEKYSNQESIELNTNTLSNGMYLLKISDGKKEGVRKVIIQH